VVVVTLAAHATHKYTIMPLQQQRAGALLCRYKAASKHRENLCCWICALPLQVGGAIETAKPEAPVDVMMGIGGTPEVGGVLAVVDAQSYVVVIQPADLISPALSLWA
jgi:hypothetical protein